MTEMVCIVCPNGCNLTVEGDKDNIKVTGAKCKKGEQFAVSELTNPKRTFSTTMRTVFKELPVVPVRTASEIPKGLIMDAMKAINSVTLDKKYKRGETVIENILNTGVDIIVTSDMFRYKA